MSVIREIPKILIDDYSLGGIIPIVNWFFDDSHKPNKNYAFKTIQENIDIVKCGGIIKTSYQNTDIFLYAALRNYDIDGKICIIVGSEQPSYESICLAYGGKPTVVDYNKPNINYPRVEVMSSLEDLDDNKYDVAFSISSFEHDGLGRYGEPLNPYGDIESMKQLKNKIKKDGYLFLAIPVSVDVLYWNAGRFYGEKRFPMLIKDWTLVESFGFENKMFSEKHIPGGNYNQPVFVLKND